MQKSIEDIKELVEGISPRNAGSIALFMENKLDLLKLCYEKSDEDTRKIVRNLIGYLPLKQFLVGTPSSKNVAYEKKAIQLHRKNGLPKDNPQQAIELYSFYFDGYKILFNCFDEKILTEILKEDEVFLKDVLSARDGVSEASIENRDNGLPKALNIIPTIDAEESVLRIDILKDMFNLFQKNKKVAITGISGIGKTFLAKHFTEYYHTHFSNIVWLNCADGFSKAFSQEKGIGLLGGLGLAQEYDSYLENEKGLMNLVIGHLVKIEGNNLLILDNIDESIYNHKDEIKFLTQNWSILGTSQKQLNGFENYIAPDFKEQSLDLFYTHYKIERDNDNLVRLLSAIEYHTLAIELLAKTAQEREFTIIALVNRFIKKGINIVEQVEIIVDHRFERKINIIENIEQYLNIIFDTSSLKDEQCKILMNIALMQEDSIPMDLFEEVYLNNSSEQDIIDVFKYNINALVKKGWVRIENERIRLHSLVKGIVLKRFSDRNDFFDFTLQYLGQALETKYTKNILEKVKYLTLSESILENRDEDTKNIVYLKQLVSLICNEIGLYERAKKIQKNNFRQAIKTKNLGIIIVALYNLANISQTQGKHEEALLYSEKLDYFFDEIKKKELYSDLIDFLTTFFKENTIDNLSKLDNLFDLKLSNHILIVDTMLSTISTIIILKDKDLLKKIEDLKKIISSRQYILNIFENNISEKLLFSNMIYKRLSLSNTNVFQRIALLYIELKEYDKAEQFLNKTLAIEEKIMEKGNFLLSSNYRHLTLLYIKCGNLEKASFFLQKNKELCSKLPKNHPRIALYKNDLDDFNKLKDEQFALKNVEKIIQEKFDILNKKEPNYTTLVHYYEILFSTYLKIGNIEKGHEYITKGINLLLSENTLIQSELVYLYNLYIKSGICYLYLENFDMALQAHNNALILYEKNCIYIQFNKGLLSTFYETLIKQAFLTDNMFVIYTRIKEELNVLQEKIKKKFSDVIFKNNLSVIIEKIFIFLFDLSDVKEALTGVEITEEKMKLFLANYDTLIDDLIKEYVIVGSIDIYETKIQYRILDDYYQAITDLFMKYKRHEIAIQYCDKRLYINQIYFEESENIGTIYHSISHNHFELKQHELSFEAIRNAINSFSFFLESQNDDTEIVELVRLQLKDSLTLEKKIKEELKNYRK